jgi:hypothetical protein
VEITPDVPTLSITIVMPRSRLPPPGPDSE